MDCAELISIIANLCTIAASIVALHVWWNWKKQQNYSFTRDKVFELELAVSELFTYELHYVEHVTNALIIHRNGGCIENAVKDEVTAKEYLRNKLLEYDLKLSSVKILKVKIDTDLFVDGIKIHQFIEDKLNIIYWPENAKHIELLQKDLICKVEQRKALMLNSLASVRKDI